MDSALVPRAERCYNKTREDKQRRKTECWKRIVW